MGDSSVDFFARLLGGPPSLVVDALLLCVSALVALVLLVVLVVAALCLLCCLRAVRRGVRSLLAVETSSGAGSWRQHKQVKVKYFTGEAGKHMVSCWDPNKVNCVNLTII